MRESQNTHSVHEHVTTESTKTSVNPLGLAGVLALFGTVLGANPVRAHSASEVGFDEADDLLIDRRSSVHYDMVRALARCAGFSASSAETIANVSQAMDFNSEDDPALFGVYGQEYFGTGSLLNPNNDAMHFANIEFSSVVSGSDIEPALDFIKDWADGTVTTLVNPSSTLWSYCESTGECCDSSGMNCIYPETEEALGAALHSIADAYSHKACGLANGPGHHGYDPTDAAYCGNDQNHGNEFGGVLCSGGQPICGEFMDVGWSPYKSYILDAAPDSTLVANTKAGIKAMRIYIEDWRASQSMGTCTASGTEITDTRIGVFVDKDSFKKRMQYAQERYNACDLACE